MKNNLEVNILAVQKEDGTVIVEGENNQEPVQVVAPAQITFAKVGKAMVGFDGMGNINYLRMSSFAPKNDGYKKPYNPFPQKKQYNSGYGSPQPFKSADKASFHWEVETKIIEKETLQMIDKVEKELTSQGKWVFAVQRYVRPLDSIKDVKNPELDHLLYDAVIYIKVKKEGARETPEELPDY